MKLKLWYFINKHAILKKIFFWIFPLLGMNVAKAETIYQCTPCPAGQSSNPGATSINGCFNPVTRVGSSVVIQGTNNASGTLQPGWYRVSLKGANGSGTGWKSGDSYCNKTERQCGYGGYNCNNVCVDWGNGASCQGNGGVGGTSYYVFYVSVAASYSYAYNGGSPKLTVNESGRVRTFSAGRGGDGSANKSGHDWRCSNGGSGASNQQSGMFSTDKSSSNYDGLGSAGIKLTRL